MTHQTQRRRRRHSAICHRHPSSKPTSGFCATCLRERLSTIQALSSSSPVSELRRTSSYSLHDNPSTSIPDQPRRKSCEERVPISMVPDSKQEEEDIMSLDNECNLLEEEEEGELKTMKEFIDLESRNHNQTKTSVFTRTLKKLSLKPPVSKQQFSLGRTSCDVDPRLSLDTGRNSFDEPRASLDGCVMGKKTYPKMVPLSCVSEVVKEEEEEKKPGGTAQTRDYYLDSRRRKSFDRSSKHGLVEVDELKAEGVGLFHGAKLLVTERELRDSNWYSIKNYKPEGLELGGKGVSCVAASEVKQQGFGVKKSGKKWGNLWGLIQRKTDTGKNEVKKTEGSLKLGGNAVEGSLAESLLKLRRVAKGDSNGDVSEKLIRSYSVSARKSCDGMFRGTSIVNGFEGGRSSCDGLFHGSITGVETRGRRSSCEDGLFHGVEGKKNHLLPRDAKLGNTYSPDNLGSGMVRFYLTPLKSHATSNSGKSRLMN